MTAYHLLGHVTCDGHALAEGPRRRRDGAARWLRGLARRWRVLPALEALVLGRDRVAIILEYADLLAPASEASFSSDGDRQSVIALHRWSYAPQLERADSLVVLLTEPGRPPPSRRGEPARRRRAGTHARRRGAARRHRGAPARAGRRVAKAPRAGIRWRGRRAASRAIMNEDDRAEIQKIGPSVALDVLVGVVPDEALVADL
jgi:hypothetical protein